MSIAISTFLALFAALLFLRIVGQGLEAERHRLEVERRQLELARQREDNRLAVTDGVRVDA